MSFKSSSCRGATKLSFLGSAQKVNELSGTALKTPNTTRLLAFLCKSGSQNGSLIGSEKSTRTPVWIFTKDFTGAFDYRHSWLINNHLITKNFITKHLITKHLITKHLLTLCSCEMFLVNNHLVIHRIQLAYLI